MTLNISAWHVHTAACTTDSCGVHARYFCHAPGDANDHCVRKGSEGTTCAGHDVLSRGDLLLATALWKATHSGRWDEKIERNEADIRLRTRIAEREREEPTAEIIPFPAPTLEDLPS